MVDIATLKRRLGLSDAPVPAAGLATTAHFFERVLNQDPLYWWEYLRGIDFHHPVEIKRLPKHKRLVRFEFADGGVRKELTPFVFFTDAGSSPFQTGTSWPNYFYKEFNVVTETLALVSTASTVSWLPDKEKRRFDRVHRTGGAVQYIISRADSPKLLYVGQRRQV